MFLEQVAGIRRSGPLVPLRSHTTRFDQAKMMKALLVRQDLFRHIKLLFPKMDQYVSHYGTIDWFKKAYNVDPDGFRPEGVPADAADPDDEPDVDPASPEKPDASDKNDCSTFNCHSVLIGLLDKLSKNQLEVALCKMALSPASVPGKSVDLAAEGAEGIKKAIETIQAKYAEDFPPDRPPSLAVGSKVTHQDLEVVTSHVVENASDYRQQLAAFNERATAHEHRAVSEFISARIVFVVEDQNNPAALGDKLCKISLLKEKKRKVAVFDASTDGPLDWGLIKKRRLNVFAGTGSALKLDRLEAWFCI